jgi:hypothetical protein
MGSKIMNPIRKISRRSFLGRIGAGTVGAGALMTLTGCATFGYSDSDPYDPIGGGYGGDGYGGRGGRSDRGGGGRGRGRGGRGRGGGGYTDNDRGPNADPAGRGRGD